MSDRGVFAIDRGIWDDPDYPAEQFSEREAVMWLVGQAAWRATRVRVGTNAIEVERGQCAFSTRFMAAAWKWSEARVRRFLGRLEARGTICSESDARATRITLCNYDKFQRVSLPSDAPATQERRKEEGKENTSLRSEKIVRARKHAWPENYWDQVWAEYGKNADMTPSRKALDALYKADRVDYTEFIEGIRRQARNVPTAQYRPSLERFIKREKWTDGDLLDGVNDAPRPSENIAKFSPRDQRRPTGVAAVDSGLAIIAARRGIGPRGGPDDRRSENGADHRPRHNDTEIADADWSPADSHHEARRRA